MKPEYSKLVSSIVGTAAFIGFLLSAYVVENVTKNHDSHEWTVMFYILAGGFAGCWLVYMPIRFDAFKNNKVGPKNDVHDIRG